MTGDAPIDSRLAGAARALEAGGLTRAKVATAGHEDEVAVISVPLAEWPRLFEPAAREMVAGVKAAGFRYVALDLDPGDEAP